MFLGKTSIVRWSGINIVTTTVQVFTKTYDGIGQRVEVGCKTGGRRGINARDIVVRAGLLDEKRQKEKERKGIESRMNQSAL